MEHAKLPNTNLNRTMVVDICFKNPILKFRIFRKIFFSNRKVISIASFSQRVEKQISIKPFFEKKNLTISTVNNTFLPLNCSKLISLPSIDVAFKS